MPSKILALAVLMLTATLSSVSAAELKSGETSGDWTYICDKADPKDAKKTPACEIAQTQMLNNKDGKQGRLLRLSIAKREKGYLLHALLPLGLHIPAGVAIKVDENTQIPMILQRCTNDGCEALMKLEEPMLANMKKGDNLKIGFNVAEKTMVIPASLKGFAAALAALK